MRAPGARRIRKLRTTNGSQSRAHMGRDLERDGSDDRDGDGDGGAESHVRWRREDGGGSDVAHCRRWVAI
jgi:hypothetical protein